jgi:hypothetical protein
MLGRLENGWGVCVIGCGGGGSQMNDRWMSPPGRDVGVRAGAQRIDKRQSVDSEIRTQMATIPV